MNEAHGTNEAYEVQGLEKIVKALPSIFCHASRAPSK